MHVKLSVGPSRWGGVIGLTIVIGLISAGSLGAQSVSGVRAFGGGVAPFFNLVGPGNLYLDNQGTTGFMYNPGNNFESFNFRNPSTGQAWSGAIMTLGPQLSVGLIQGANQTGTPTLLVPPPRIPPPVAPIQSDLLDIP